MHLSSASPRGGPQADVGEYGDFMGTLQQISAPVVGEMWGLRFFNALLSGKMWGLRFCSTERRLGTIFFLLDRWQDDKNCQVDGQEESVFCTCRSGEEGFMIQCSDCNEWFQGECVQVTEQDADQIKDYSCAICLEAAVEP